MRRSWFLAAVLIGLVFTTFPLCAQGVPVLSVARDLLIDATKENLAPMTNVAISARGEIAIGQETESKVLFYSPAGVRRGEFGRKGDGPKEFRDISYLGWIGDTLWVSHSGGPRKFISPDLKLLRVAPQLPMGVYGPKGEIVPGGYINTAFRADGSSLREVIFFAVLPPWIGPSPPEASRAMVIVGPDTRIRRVIAWSPPTVLCDGELCFLPRTVVESDGSRAAFLIPDYDNKPRYQLVVINDRGDTTIARYYAFEPVRVTAAMIDSAAAARRLPRAIFERGNAAPQIMTGGNRPVPNPPLPLPTIRLGADRIVLGRDGTVWVREQPRENRAVWRVLDAKGDLIGTVTLPSTALIKAAERHVFWAIEVDDDGLQSVARYRVR